ncbi:hypothetical protein PISMIDRAFT_680822 [Pisolithus microcarpus 441]|uniref:Uncharacterized protein n=1 Tax=Pisolithus microcarpus 441 TaxID=765257 RepID=A0A0C9ZQR8_9AGAM|nr:hypothetical protein PISMIDRAFT_680822 [Pisolithus microcarpus 441]
MSTGGAPVVTLCAGVRFGGTDLGLASSILLLLQTSHLQASSATTSTFDSVTSMPRSL